jgi:hypothetical protein
MLESKDSSSRHPLRATGQPDYDVLAAKADADPARLMEEVFKFCVVRLYRPTTTCLSIAPSTQAVPALANPEAVERLREQLNFK